MSKRSRVPTGWTAPPGIDTAIDTVHQIRAVAFAWLRLTTDFAARAGLHPTDATALVHLLDAQRTGATATPGWLGAQMGMHSPAVTALINRLENAGLVLRERDGSDRRRVRLEVTAQALDEGWDFFESSLQPLLDALRSKSAEDLGAVNMVLGEALTILRGDQAP